MLFALLAVSGGCLVTSVDPAARPPVDASPPAAFDYVADDPRDIGVSLPRAADDDLTMVVATLPKRETLPGTAEPVEIELYYHAAAPRPVVLVLPILGGRYDVERGLTQYMARQGLAAAMLKRRGRLLDASQNMATARAAFLGAVIDVRRTIDWLATRSEVVGDRIGLFGISRGGIVASLAGAIDPRVDAVTLALAGGGIPTMIARSSEPEVVDFRDAQVRRLGSFDEFMARARDMLHDIDPLVHAHRLDPQRVLMMNARFDAVIPAANYKALWVAAGKPTLYEFPVGHYGLVAFLWYCRAKAFEHFKAILIQKGDDLSGKPLSRVPGCREREHARHTSQCLETKSHQRLSHDIAVIAHRSCAGSGFAEWLPVGGEEAPRQSLPGIAEPGTSEGADQVRGPLRPGRAVEHRA